MSFPAKENLIFFETLATKQKNLWNDSSDHGIELNNKTFGDISLKDAARDNLLALMENYAYKLERTNDRKSSKTSIFIPYEFDEGAYAGVDLHVTYIAIGKCQYLQVAIKRAYKTHAEANINGKMFKMPSVEEPNSLRRLKVANRRAAKTEK